MLVKPILCHDCEVWSTVGLVGNKSDLGQAERIQRRFLKGPLGVHMQTTNHRYAVHVLADFGRYPQQLSWQAYRPIGLKA